MTFHAIGFGSLNIDEFWEVPGEFLKLRGMRPGEEYVRDAQWFADNYPVLGAVGSLKASDPGGSAANMIAAMRRMGFSTGFYGATGSVDESLLRLGDLGQSDDLRILMSQVPAGRCLALIDREDPARDRTLVVLPNANDLAGDFELDLGYFEASQWVHMTSFVSSSPLRTQAELAGKLSGETRLSFDPGPIYCARGIAELEPILVHCSVLFVTNEESVLLTGRPDVDSSVGLLMDLGINTVVVKKGAQGIEAIDGPRRQKVWVPASSPIRIVDRTGAGDVVAAAFIAGKISGLELVRCVEFSVLAAVRSIGGYGRSAYPDRRFLEKFLAPVA